MKCELAQMATAMLFPNESHATACYLVCRSYVLQLKEIIASFIAVAHSEQFSLQLETTTR